MKQTSAIVEGILHDAAEHFTAQARIWTKDQDATPCNVVDALAAAYPRWTPTTADRAGLCAELKRAGIPAPASVETTTGSTDWDDLMAAAAEDALYKELERRYPAIAALNRTI